MKGRISMSDLARREDVEAGLNDYKAVERRDVLWLWRSGGNKFSEAVRVGLVNKVLPGGKGRRVERQNAAGVDCGQGTNTYAAGQLAH